MTFEEATKTIQTQQYRRLRSRKARQQFGVAKVILRRAGTLPKGRFMGKGTR